MKTVSAYTKEQIDLFRSDPDGLIKKMIDRRKEKYSTKQILALGRNMEILRLYCTTDLSLLQVANLFGITKERVRQINSKLLRMVRWEFRNQ